MATKTRGATVPSALAERLHLPTEDSDLDSASRWVRAFDALSATDLPSVGGKNAVIESKGEAGLPLIKVGDDVVSSGAYPSRDELSAWAGLTSAPQPMSAAKSG